MSTVAFSCLPMVGMPVSASGWNIDPVVPPGQLLAETDAPIVAPTEPWGRPLSVHR
jgi:hypothetical protein